MRMLELTTVATRVHKQPRCDFVIIIHKNDMKKEGISNMDDVLLIGKKSKLKIKALCVSHIHKYAKNSNIKEGKTVAIDETYREALRLQNSTANATGDMVIIKKLSHVHKYNILNRLGSSFTKNMREYLNYQKAVMRSYTNSTFKESKVPMVSVCSEMLELINAEYGDQLVVESANTAIAVRCTKLSHDMREYHDNKLNPALDSTNKPDETHVMFMDSISRNLLGIEVGDPIKIRRRFVWEIKKKISGFGALSLVGLSVIIPTMTDFPSLPSTVSEILPFIHNIVTDFRIWWLIILSVITIWSVLTTSMFRSRGTSD